MWLNHEMEWFSFWSEIYRPKSLHSAKTRVLIVRCLLKSHFQHIHHDEWQYVNVVILATGECWKIARIQPFEDGSLSSFNKLWDPKLRVNLSVKLISWRGQHNWPACSLNLTKLDFGIWRIWSDFWSQSLLVFHRQSWWFEKMDRRNFCWNTPKDYSVVSSKTFEWLYLL